jgi:hypothetical protein
VIGLVLVTSITSVFFVTGITMGVLLVLVTYLRRPAVAGDGPRRVRAAGPDLAISDYRGTGGVPWKL